MVMHQPYIVLTNIISINTLPTTFLVSSFVGERDLLRWIQRCFLFDTGLDYVTLRANRIKVLSKVTERFAQWWAP